MLKVSAASRRSSTMACRTAWTSFGWAASHAGHGRRRPFAGQCRAVSASSVTSRAAEVAYEPVIGIETHVQLRTHTKAFCACKHEYGAEPNTHVCPVCTAQPGALPVLNKECVRLGVLAGVALNCTIARRCSFDRKHYFYADLPKGYQISQYEEPLCYNGSLPIFWQETRKEGKKKAEKIMRTKDIGITRAHLEEDAGKNVHSGAGGLSGSSHSLVDLNRAGVPLLEIVTEPDFRSGVEAAAYGEELRRIVRFLGISDGNMQEGSLRCDVNISVREVGSERLGTKVEIKNMSSFSAMQRAIEYEYQRQSKLIRAGRGAEVVQETRTFDDASQSTIAMRKKEGLADYRYFPEPDLPSLDVSENSVVVARLEMPELPAAVRDRLLRRGLATDVVLLLAEDTATVAFFDEAVREGADPVQAGNWIQRDLMAWCKEQGVRMDGLKMSARTLAEAIQLVADGTISSKIAKELTPDLLEGAAEGKGVQVLVDERGMGQISDPAAVAEVVRQVLEANPKQVEEYRGGKTKLQGFFQGQVMKASGGRINPAVLSEVLLKQLQDES